MKRLTKEDILNISKDLSFILPRLVGKQMCLQMINELLEYKRIEEDLGVDLPTLFKALKDRFYVANDKYNTDKCFGALAYNFNCSELAEEKRWSILGFAYGYEAEEWKFPEDYGKTWALTEEELNG